MAFFTKKKQKESYEQQPYVKHIEIESSYNNSNNSGNPRKYTNQRSSRITKKSKFGIIFLSSCIVLLIALIVAVSYLPPYSSTDNEETEKPKVEEKAEEKVAPDEEQEEEWTPTYLLATDNIYSRHAILYDATNDVIMSKFNENDIVFPASITKIMTGIVAIENIPNMESEVTITTELTDYLYEQGASVAGFSSGEVVEARDLLYACLVPSGADGAIGLAWLISGTEDDFVIKMNEKAQELGMENTHYSNCTGLHDDDHYTTAADTLILLKYAMKNELFRTVIQTMEYVSSATTIHPDGIYMLSTIQKAINTSGLENLYIKGGKTGYTPEAGLCFASIDEIDGNYYYLITFGAGWGSNSPEYHLQDHIYILNDLAATVRLGS